MKYRIVERKKYYHICSDIDIDRFSNIKQKYFVLELKKRIGVPQNSFIIGIVGRLSALKGHIFLIKSLKQDIEKDDRMVIKCLIIGDG